MLIDLELTLFRPNTLFCEIDLSPASMLSLILLLFMIDYYFGLLPTFILVFDRDLSIALDRCCLDPFFKNVRAFGTSDCSFYY